MHTTAVTVTTTALAGLAVAVAAAAAGVSRADAAVVGAHCRADLVAATMACTGYVPQATVGTGRLTVVHRSGDRLSLVAELPRVIDFSPGGTPIVLVANLDLREVGGAAAVSGTARVGRTGLRVAGAGSRRTLDLVLTPR